MHNRWTHPFSSVATQVPAWEDGLKARHDISSVLSRQPQNAGRRSCKSTGKVFRWNALGNPRHQKLSAGAIISNAGSHRSQHPVTDARRSVCARCSHLSHTLWHFSPSSAPAIFSAPVAGGYFVTTVIIFLSLRLIPRRCENINTIVNRQNDSGHSHRKWRRSYIVCAEDETDEMVIVCNIYLFYEDLKDLFIYLDSI